jgi:hypothetical protein
MNHDSTATHSLAESLHQLRYHGSSVRVLYQELLNGFEMNIIFAFPPEVHVFCARALVHIALTFLPDVAAFSILVYLTFTAMHIHIAVV